MAAATPCDGGSCSAIFCATVDPIAFHERGQGYREEIGARRGVDPEDLTDLHGSLACLTGDRPDPARAAPP